MAITLIDAENDSLTVSWEKVDGASKYVLQYRRAVSSDNEDADFETLSDKLTSTQARKKNLVDEKRVGFVFRVKSEDSSSWQTHEAPFLLLSEDAEKARMNEPSAQLAGSNEALIVSWKAQDGAASYEVQMRENVGGSEWKTIAASFANTQVKKKNLDSPQGYQFRIRPNLESGEAAFSKPSTPVIPLGLYWGIQQMFGSLEEGTLLRQKDKVPLEEALGGKEFILLYASASWCGPCRQFSPMLTQWYQSLGANKTVEVVFLSADHDAGSFWNYYSHMPWLAIDHDEDAREEIMAQLRVSGIPRLAVMDGRTGKIIEDNAVGKPLDINRWRSMIKK